MYVIGLCVLHTEEVASQMLIKQPTMNSFDKCHQKKVRHPLQESIMRRWIAEMGGDKERTLGKIISTIFDITDGNDDNTIDVLSYNMRLFTHYICCGYMGPDRPKYLTKHMREGSDKVKHIMKMHPGLRYIENSVVLTSQGIDVVPPKVKEYIRQRDIIDAGAFEGDSMVILQNHTDQHIYGYEPSKKNFDRILINIENWKYNKTKNTYFNYGLGDEDKYLFIKHQASGSKTVDEGNIENRIKIVTLGDEIKKRNIKLGSIKADTEGYSWPIILGALNDIRKERPVFLILVYHCYDEYVRIPEFIKGLGNYIIQYRADQNNDGAMSETQVIGYPAEVVYPHYNKI